MPHGRRIFFRDLGVMDYKACWDYQEKLFAETLRRKSENRDLPAQDQIQTEDHLLFVEHPHVYTLGKSGKEQHLLVDENGLTSANATYYRINRGGDITYHGPGQLVGYPILDLDHFFTDIHKYLRLLEETIILTLSDFGIEAGRSKGETGVWLDADMPARARKICAMGVRCSRWVTMHGWAFNVNTDLSYFRNIVPCGITDKAVTSLSAELGHDVSMEAVKEKVRLHFSALFQAELIEAAVPHADER
jgi:lipoyl(octanoyl) transferase